MVDTYRLYCNKCAFSRIVDKPEEVEDLREVKKSKLQSKLPFYDHEKNRKIETYNIKQLKQFKCPKCGFLIKPFKLKGPDNNEKDNTSRS